MAERRINWGSDATDARYRTEDTGDGADFVVAEDLDGGTLLLYWDDTAGEWKYGGPVNLQGADINSAGTVDAQTVNATELISSHATQTDFENATSTTGAIGYIEDKETLAVRTQDA